MADAVEIDSASSSDMEEEEEEANGVSDEEMRLDQDANIYLDYSTHIDDAQKILQTGSDSVQSVKTIYNIAKASTPYAKREQNTQQTLLGSEALYLCSQVSKVHIGGFQTTYDAFDQESFIQGIKNAIGNPDDYEENEDEDWTRLSKKICSLFSYASSFSHMYGSFTPAALPPKVVKERQQRKLKSTASQEIKRPEQIAATDASNKRDEVSKKIQKIVRRECDNGPVSYFRLVLNPDSFALTVENIFHLSFMAFSNHIKILLDSDGLPMVHLIREEEAARAKESKKLQCVVIINMEEWKELVEAYNITAPLIPPE